MLTVVQKMACKAVLIMALILFTDLLFANSGNANKLPVNSSETSVLSIVPRLPESANKIIDVRRESICKKKSISTAVCVPPEHIVADNNRLANFSGLFWTLGTLGLTGDETVYIIGDKDHRKRFIAGWFLISGQREIRIVSEPVSAVLDSSSNVGLSIGIPVLPAKTRKKVFSALPRTDRILTRSEVVAALTLPEPSTLIDGRTEAEYWGRAVKSIRGGHLPGAILYDKEMDVLMSSENIIVYAHNAVDGLAFLAELELQEFNAKLYLGGWAEWSVHTSLPADAETYSNEGAILKGNVPSLRKSEKAVESVAAMTDEKPARGGGYGLVGNFYQLGFLAMVVLAKSVVSAFQLGRCPHKVGCHYG